MKYKYSIEGTAADGQTWKTDGLVYTTRRGSFPDVLHNAMKLAFDQLCEGKAVYGHPGLGCMGPYTVTKYSVELEQ